MKRKYVRRIKPEEQKNAVQIGVKDQSGVNWCPCCGMDMRAVNLAVRLVKSGAVK
jgi:hypothetical protein